MSGGWSLAPDTLALLYSWSWIKAVKRVTRASRKDLSWVAWIEVMLRLWILEASREEEAGK